ncbi:MAG: hypothetical protein LBI28_00380 [Treponema sp.]|nr:hypothetical protein [Treponema sp.]
MNSRQIEIGEIEAQFNPPLSLGTLKKENVKVLYFPQEDAVCLQYKHEFVTYHQFWSAHGRRTFAAALAKYNEDYDARNLNAKGGRRTRSTYGSVKGYLIWQMFSFTVQARANMNLGMGYEFKERSPYFTINQGVAEYREEISRDNNKNSPIIALYFTRAQAAELAALFDPAFLRELGSPGGNNIPIDPYRDNY